MWAETEPIGWRDRSQAEMKLEANKSTGVSDGLRQSGVRIRVRLSGYEGGRPNLATLSTA
jgi:hypothetical protein